MQFLVTAYDYPDAATLERRLSVRGEHLALIGKLKISGNVLMAVAILDDGEKVIGSVLICQFDTRRELDDWLKREPYVTAQVWERITVQPCLVGPFFLHQ